MKLTTNEIRERFLNFFKEKNHAILDSASLVTTDEKTVTNATLFNTAGVQPLIPYLLGKEHSKGNKLVSSQKCIRTIDIDEVGDNTHLTFFEMLGNWSLGDYFKNEAIKMSYDFLTSKENGLGLNPERLYITVFAGNNVCEADQESFNAWQDLVPENRIYFLDSNWWEAGDNGPCGPDTEMFYDLTENGLGDISSEKFIEADDKQDVVEIWNNVFMQFLKKDGEIKENLEQHAVDTGAGLERLSMVVNQKQHVFQTDNFSNLIEIIESSAQKFDVRSARIIIDHLKASHFMISDGVTPSNTDRGYVLRRLLRKTIQYSDLIALDLAILNSVLKDITDQYQNIYELDEVKSSELLVEEKDKFLKAYKKGEKKLQKEYKKLGKIPGELVFELETAFGLSKEMLVPLAKNSDYKFEDDAFEIYKKLTKEHQEKSRNTTQGRFKGGLASAGENELRYHTATHLLHQALVDVLGDHVEQKGSNINSERLRFDFTHTEKLTDEEINKVEKLVNEKIAQNLPIKMIKLPKSEALETGAKHLFADKYDDEVTIYYVGHNFEDAYSKEFCGGPHVENTNELGKFTIVKEKASSSGIRRIKATLDK